MKNLLKNFLIFIGRIYSLFYPRKIMQYGETFSAYIYTGFQSHRFHSWGKNSVMAKGVRLTGPEYISVGQHTAFLRDVYLTATSYYAGECHHPSIVIGNDCQFGARTHITAVNDITIGNGVLTGADVLISDNAHGDSTFKTLQIPPLQRPLYSKGKIAIGDNVWIGDKVSILAGVTIGNNVIIGANSVVTKDIPDRCIAAGIPAKIIKQH